MHAVPHFSSHGPLTTLSKSLLSPLLDVVQSIIAATEALLSLLFGQDVARSLSTHCLPSYQAAVGQFCLRPEQLAAPPGFLATIVCNWNVPNSWLACVGSSYICR
jgi:hypothetical protein